MSTLDMGNDREAARQELVGQYGVHQNAEQLIQAHRASRDPLLTAASLKEVDAEATAELDTGSIDLPEGHEVVTAVVRGSAIVYVAEDERGTYYKGAQLLEEGKGAPKQTAADVAARAWDVAAAGQRELAVNELAAVEADVQAYRAEKLAELGEKLREQAAESNEAAQAEAEAAAAPAEEKPKASKAKKGEE